MEKPSIKTENRPKGFMPGPVVIGAPTDKAKDFKGTLKKLARYLKPHWRSLLIVVIFAISSTVFAIVSPKILGQATNQIVEDYASIKIYEKITDNLPAGVVIPSGTTLGNFTKQIPASMLESIPADKLSEYSNLDISTKPQFHFDAIIQIAYFLICLYVVSAILSYIQAWIMSGLTQKITYKFREDISSKINRLPLKYFDNKTYGEILSRVTNDVETISQSLNQSMSQIITSVVTIIGIAIMMLTISWLLTVITILVLPISFGLLALLAKNSQPQFIKQQNSLGELNGHVEEMYSGHNVMRVFNGEKDSLKRFNKINDELYQSAWKSQFVSGLMFPLMGFAGNLGYVATAVAGGWLAINGQLKIGDIQAFIQYVQQFNQPITQTANIANVLQSTMAAAERVFEFLGETEQSEDTKNPKKLPVVRGEVEFKNVIFGYNEDKTIIKNLSTKIEPGHRVAIVGPTGAGKTTLVNLLMRFYEINSGSITIDGIDIKNMKRSEVRSLFGMVLQDTWLFNGTIRDNLKYGNDKATEEEIIQAAREAHVDHFVRSLPNGYDAELNEEASNISQGEKQLLTIARAMIARAPMLILDEATSSVDTRTEVLIQKAMDNLMKNKTSFVIAHRLSTIRDANLILVVKDGNIVEHGNHKELLAMNGFYAEIYNSQFSVST